MPQLDSLILFDQVFLTVNFFLLFYVIISVCILPTIRVQLRIRFLVTRLNFCRGVVMWVRHLGDNQSTVIDSRRSFGFINWIKK